jgi:putative ABC transport system substrate-binding protein
VTTRRDWLVTLGAGACTLGVPIPALAQAAAGQRRIAVLSVSTAAGTRHLWALFRSGLRDLGWIEGDNLVLDMRFAESDPARAAALTAELLAHKPDVFVSGTDREARAAAAATRSVPIVFAVGADPVGLGLVKSLASPGGNVTGLAVLGIELNPKRLSLLKEALPRLEKAGMLFSDGDASKAAALEALEKAARQLGIKLLPAGVGNVHAFETAFETIARGGAKAVLTNGGSLFFQHGRRFADLAIRHRIAALANTTEGAEAGALLSYGTDLKENVKRLAPLVDRILKGANPATIPVEQPNVYELVVNLRTARSLGIELPSALLLQASRVIE